MTFRTLMIAIGLTVVPALGLAGDVVKITTGGHTLEFPCSEITDDTDLTCEEVCSNLDAQDGVSCEVVDGIMFVESDEWISQTVIERAVSTPIDDDDETPPKMPSTR